MGLVFSGRLVLFSSSRVQKSGRGLNSRRKKEVLLCVCRRDHTQPGAWVAGHGAYSSITRNVAVEHERTQCYSSKHLVVLYRYNMKKTRKKTRSCEIEISLKNSYMQAWCDTSIARSVRGASSKSISVLDCKSILSLLSPLSSRDAFRGFP